MPRSFKLAINLLLWTDFVEDAHLPIIQRLASIGYDGVEIPHFSGTLTHYKQLGKQISDLGLGITSSTAVDAEHNPISPVPAIRRNAVDSIKRALDRANAMGATLLIGPIHSALGVFSGRAPTADEFQRSADTLRAVADHAKAANVKIALEYLNRFENYLLTTMTSAVQMVDAVDHPSIGLMFDTFHAHIEEKDSVAALNQTGDRLLHVHLSENDRGVPGTGQVNWLPVMHALKARHYDAWYTIESFGRGLPNVAAATRVWRDLASSPDEVATKGYEFIRKTWKDA